MAALLFVSYSGAFGGAERVLLDCASAVEGASVVACPEGPLAARARDAGLTVLTIGAHRPNVRGSMRDRLLAPPRLLAHAIEPRALIGTLKPDAVVVWGMRSAIASLALPARCPRVVAHHDMLPGRLTAAAVRRAAARASVVIVPSQAVAADLDPEHALAGRLRVVHPGVDPERFSGPRAPADPPEVLVLGALVAWKHPQLALEACAQARREVPELRLRLAGAPLFDDQGTLLRRLRLRASRADLVGAVEIIPETIEPEPALARANCLLHCAPNEPFGLVIVEALAAGCPAVVPGAGGPSEIVNDACARRYPPGDAAAAARAIVEVVTDSELAAHMGAAGRRRARTRFHRERMVSEFAAALAPLSRTRADPAVAGELALVTVSHNSERELAGLLESVGRNLPRAQVVVVDNGSTDGSVEVARRWPQATTVALEENIGFGRACNRGLGEVRAPATALLNPDVELLDDSLLDLAWEALRDDRPQRLLAPLVLNEDGTRQDSVHPAPVSLADLVRSLVPPALVPPPLGASTWPWRSPGPRRVGWAVGCALVAATATLRRLGPFDERIFLYGEDLELGLRAAQAGVQTWFWPSARVLHHRAHAARIAFGDEPFERLAHGRHDVVARRLGRGRAVLDDRAQAVTFGSRLILKRALGLAAGRERRQLQALRSLQGRGGMR